MPSQNIKLAQFFEVLDHYQERVPLDLLTDLIARLNISIDDVREYLHFSRERYRRNLMHDSPGYQALVLCWLNGQRSAIHDHEGSSCGVLILQGVATETVFDRAANGMIFATHSRELNQGEICGSEDADIHQVSNLQPNGSNLVTLHVYSPPLTRFNCYSLEMPNVRTIDDPVMEFAWGAGI